MNVLLLTNRPRGLADLFEQEWPRLRTQNWYNIPKEGTETFHKSADKNPWMKLLLLGWDIPISDVEAINYKRATQ